MGIRIYRVPDESPPGMVHAALARHTGFLLSRAGMVAQRHFAQRLETLGLTPRIWGALNVIDAESPLNQHELGRLIGMDPSSMVAAIDELERRDLVQRRPHPSDRRAHALFITNQGRETLARGRELARSAQGELLAPLSADERQVLHELLLRVVQRTGVRGDLLRQTRSPSAGG